MTGPAGGGPIWTGAPPLPEPTERFITAVVADGPWGGGGTLSVDPERAQECIDGLRRAVGLINDALLVSDHFFFPPPGNDPVSVNLAEQAAIMGNRAIAFAESWRQQLVETITGLEEQLAAYRRNEDEIRVRFE